MKLKEVVTNTKDKVKKSYEGFKELSTKEKALFIGGGIVILTGAIGLVVIYKRASSIVDGEGELLSEKLAEANDSWKDKLADSHVGVFAKTIEGKKRAEIDDAIFTDLAPEIEEVCINPGIEEFFSERFFSIGDRICKHITVRIENIVGD